MSECCCNHHHKEDEHHHEHRPHSGSLWKDSKFISLLFVISFAIGIEIFSLYGMDIPMPYAPFIIAAIILFAGYNVVLGGLKALLKLDFSSINLLMLIAVTGAFYLGEYPEAAVVIVLYVLGERLEDIGFENSKSALNDLVRKFPKTATLKSSGEKIEVEKIPVNTIIQVKPYDVIPLDGVIEIGTTSVDESSITGEPIPKDKHAGDIVFAGTMNKSGFIEIKTTKTSEDSTFSKIIKMTFEAGENRGDSQRFIQRFAKYYTPSDRKSTRLNSSH